MAFKPICGVLPRVSYRKLYQSPLKSSTFSTPKLPARFGVSRRSLYTLADRYEAETPEKRVTLLPGDGIGPEVCNSVVGIFQAADVPVEWEIFENVFDTKNVGENPRIFQDSIASIARNRVCLKGPFYTPFGKEGYISKNLKIRKDLDLYANIVPCSTLKGLKTRHSNQKIDLVIIRENTQAEYSGFEQEIEPGVVQSLKIVTENASRRIAEYAFQYAVTENRKRVHCVHKANIQKLTDGLFLRVCREVAQKYPQIEFRDIIIDNCCMQLVMNPGQFDVVLTPNLYGTVVTNVVAGLIGGPGVVGGANIGNGIALFEAGARHVAQDIAKQNKANPTALLLSANMMLRQIGLGAYATRIEKALHRVMEEGKVRTADLGGTATTKEFTKAIISAL